MLKKLSFVLVIAALVVGVSASSASAQTTTTTGSTVTTTGTTGGYSSYVFTRDLTLGSTGADVSALQSILVGGGYLFMPAGVNMGYFGALTQAAVSKWQAAVGISPTAGYVGPISRAKLNGMTTTTTTTTTTTNLPAGCATTAGYSSITGVKCDSGSTLPAGCTPGAMFSSTTGVKCVAGSTSTSTSSTPDGVSEGELKNFDGVSADENSFSEGETNELYAFEMEADGSDMMVSRVDIYMGQTEVAESNNADDYFESATLFVDGEEVADLDVSDWDEDDWDQTADTDHDEYRLRFVTDFTVNDGDTPVVTVEFEAANNIDSGDSDNATWQIDLATDSVRAEDEAGFTDEYGESMEETITVDDVQAADLDVSLNSDNPEEQVISVDDTDDTDGVNVLAFDLEAGDGDVMIEEIAVTVDDVGTLTDVNAVAKTLHLLRGGVKIASESLPTGAGQTEVVTFEIDENDADEGLINDGDTAEFTVEADIHNLDGGDFDAGDGIVVSFTSVLAEDEAGDNVEADGSANGENMTFYVVAPEVTYVSDDIDKNAGEDASAEATDDSADGIIVFKVKAVGGVIYINGDNETTDEKEGILLTNGQGGDLDVLGDYSYTVSGANVNTTNAGADNEYFTIPEGATATFTLSFHLDPAADGFFGGNVASIQFGTASTDEDTRSASAITTGVVADDLETALVQLDDGA